MTITPSTSTTVREELEERYPNLHLVGRNGMHKYNNQDHAMMTAMLCVENILADTKLYDLWQVNGDAEYHEAGEAAVEETQGTALRQVPSRVPATPELASEQRKPRVRADVSLTADASALILTGGHRPPLQDYSSANASIGGQEQKRFRSP